MDFIPNKRGDRYLWWKNLDAKIDVEGPKIGLLPAEITAIKAVTAAEIAIYEATDAAETALKGARVTEKNSPNEAIIRNQARYWKTKPGYDTSGVEGVLNLKGPASAFDPNTFKPSVTLSLVGGQIKVEFTKGGCDSVAIYTRLRGSTGWTRLGTDSSSPYYDTRPLAAATAPETREYQLVGIIDDEEIGQPSDIVSIIFG